MLRKKIVRSNFFKRKITKPKVGKTNKKSKLNKNFLMPNPGPCAWLDYVLEFKLPNRAPYELDDWLFLWSNKLKAVIAVPSPEYLLIAEPSRSGGAAKKFEEFTSEKASNFYYLDIPALKMKDLGEVEHIVYVSDKWNPGVDVDYIHEFGHGVHLYRNSWGKHKIYLARGGKLTLTPRGLVF